LSFSSEKSSASTSLKVVPFIAFSIAASIEGPFRGSPFGFGGRVSRPLGPEVLVVSFAVLACCEPSCLVVFACGMLWRVLWEVARLDFPLVP